MTGCVRHFSFCDHEPLLHGREIALAILLRIEQRWLPVWAGRLPLPTPTPLRVGTPSGLFEHTSTIARWVEGEPADHAPVTRVDAAEVLASPCG